MPITMSPEEEDERKAREKEAEGGMQPDQSVVDLSLLPLSRVPL